MGRAGRRPPGLRPGRAPLRGAPCCCAAGACGRLPAPCTDCKRGTGPPLAPAPTQLPAGGRAGKSRGCCVWGNMCRRRGGRRPPGRSPGRAPLRGAPRCCAAGACGRLSAPCTGCKRGADPPLAPAPRSCLPGAGPSPREVQGNLQTRRFSCKSSAVIQFSGIFPAGRPKTPVKTQEKIFRLAFFAPKDLIFRPHFAMIKGNTLSKRGTGHDTGPASADQR